LDLALFSLLVLLLKAIFKPFLAIIPGRRFWLSIALLPEQRPLCQNPDIPRGIREYDPGRELIRFVEVDMRFFSIEPFQWLL
jgi:hypothetical protein